MIKIRIETNGKDVLDSLSEKDITLNECAMVVFRLEEIKKYLLSIDFKSKFEVREGCFTKDDKKSS